MGLVGGRTSSVTGEAMAKFFLSRLVVGNLTLCSSMCTLTNIALIEQIQRENMILSRIKTTHLSDSACHAHVTRSLGSSQRPINDAMACQSSDSRESRDTTQEHARKSNLTMK